MRVGSPAPMLTINTVGSTIAEYGTDEQKEFFPQIAAGKLISVSAIANLMLVQINLINNKVRDGDEYVINGQNMDQSALGAIISGLPPVLIMFRSIRGYRYLPFPSIHQHHTRTLSFSPHNINHTFFDDVAFISSIIVEENQVASHH